MKILKSLGIAFGIVLLSFGTACATVSPYPASYTNWGPGMTITSAWLNSVEQMIGTGSTSTSVRFLVTSTSTPLGQIANSATTTGSILVASSTSGWSSLAVGQNGYCPIASSSAPYGIVWGICGGSINGFTSQAYIINASGTGLSILQNGSTTTVQIDPTKYLQPSNNLSELTNTSTARANLGLTGAAIMNLPVSVANGGTATSTAPTDGQYLGANGATPTYKSFVAGAGISIATTTTSTVITSSVSGSVAGSDTQIQYNNSGAFGATSTFTYTSSTQQLNLGTVSSSINIGTIFASTTIPTTFSYTGASTTWTVPAGVTSITINVQGAGGGQTSGGYVGSPGASATGTLAVTPGTTYTILVAGAGGNGGISSGGPGGFADGSNAGGCIGNGDGGGGGKSWISTVGTFSTTTAILSAAGGAGSGATCGSPGAGGTPTWLASSLTATSTNATAGAAAGVNGKITIFYQGHDNVGSLNVGGHIIVGGNAPTLSSCGSSPSVLGNDTAAVITTGSGSPTACTIVWATPWINPPIVVANTSIAAYVEITTNTTTSTILTFSSAVNSGKVYYHAFDY